MKLSIPITANTINVAIILTSSEFTCFASERHLFLSPPFAIMQNAQGQTLSTSSTIRACESSSNRNMIAKYVTSAVVIAARSKLRHWTARTFRILR